MMRRARSAAAALLLVPAARAAGFDARLLSVDVARVELDWAPPAAGAPEQYMIEARCGDEAEWRVAAAADGAATSAAVYELRGAGAPCALRVGALYGSVLAVPGVYSNEVRVTPGSPSSPRIRGRGGCGARAPSAPRAFAPGVEDTQVVLLFDPPAATPAPLLYVVQARAHLIGAWRDMAQAPPGATGNASGCPDTLRVVVGGLKPATKYEFRVAARFAAGGDAASPSAKAETRGRRCAASAFGRPLFPPPPGGGELPVPSWFPSTAAMDAAVDAARAEYAVHPSEENLVWLAKMLGFAWRWDDEMALLADGARRFPQSARIPLELGHRHLGLRELATAQRWLELAKANVAGLPELPEVFFDSKAISRATAGMAGSVQFNIFYHLGHSYLFDAQYEKAAAAYAEGLTWAYNYPNGTVVTDDGFISMTRWGNAALQAAGTPAAAARAAALLRNVSAACVGNGTKRACSEYRCVGSDWIYYDALMLWKGAATPAGLLAEWSDGRWATLGAGTMGYAVAQFLRSDAPRGRPYQQLVATIRGGEWWAGFDAIGADFDALRLSASAA